MRHSNSLSTINPNWMVQKNYFDCVQLNPIAKWKFLSLNVCRTDNVRSVMASMMASSASHMHKLENSCDRTENQQGHLGVSSLLIIFFFSSWQKEEQTKKNVVSNRNIRWRQDTAFTAKIWIECVASSPIHAQTHYLKTKHNELVSQWKYQFTHILLWIIRRRIIAGTLCSRIMLLDKCRPNGKSDNNNNRHRLEFWA